MSWGHATSRDLLHWTEHPVAIACDEAEDIFSGSVVVDHGQHQSGLGTADAPALVAIYTSAYKAGSEHQRHAGPVPGLQHRRRNNVDKNTKETLSSTRNSANFRDPKVFRYKGDQGSLLGHGRRRSPAPKGGLLPFGRPQELGLPERPSARPTPTGGEWECPDLFPLAVDGDPDNIKWVLIVNVNPGAVAGGSGGQYFVGHFDGVHFTPDPIPSCTRRALLADPRPDLQLQQYLWLDWGRDCYASVSFSNVPDDRRIMIGWMNNWDYANELPTAPWRSSMTLAREVRLHSSQRLRPSGPAAGPGRASAQERAGGSPGSHGRRHL